MKKFELSRGGDAQNVRPMEGLRGFAVFLVFLVHYVTLVDPWLGAGSLLQAFAKAVHSLGSTGVDLFFVLSGFLIYGSLMARPQPFLRFIHRRIQRIYPTFLVVFAIYMALSYVLPAENKIPAPVFAGIIYLIQNILLLPGIFDIQPMISVAWSLSYEMFYYLLVPLVIGLLRLRRRSATWRICFFAFVVIVGIIYCSSYGGPYRLLMFVAGMLLHELLPQPQVANPSSLLALVALIAGLLVNAFPNSFPGGFLLKFPVLFGAFLLLCLSCFREPQAALARAFSWTPLRWLGNMSYSYYLLHSLALKAGFLVMALVLVPAGQGGWVFWPLLPLMFVVTLLPSAVLFLAVERPLSLVPRRQPLAIASGAAGSAASHAP